MKIGLQKDFIFHHEITQMCSSFSSHELEEVSGIDPQEWIDKKLDRVFVNENYLLEAPYLPSTEEIRRLGFFEWVERTAIGWEPKSRLYETIRQAIRSSAPDLDVKSGAYVTGFSQLSRGLLSVLAQMGYSKLNWVVLPEQVEDIKTLEVIKEIKRYHFSLQLNVMDFIGLSSRYQDGSLLINTSEATAPGMEFEDVLFFNFLSPRALCCDLAFARDIDSPVISEAKKENMRSLSRSLVGEIWLSLIDAS